MQRLIFAAALGLASGSAFAFGMPCDKPEYMQLKSADKSELQQEFCRTTRMHDMNLRLRKSTETGISELRAMGADVSKHLAASEQELKDALSFSRAAAEYAGAIQRRFKSKPPAVKACLSPGGI